MMPVQKNLNDSFHQQVKPETETESRYSAIYQKILKDLGTLADSWERDNFFKKNIQPLFQEIAPEELAAHKEDLLLKSSTCNAYDVTELLLKRFSDWPLDILKTAADTSAQKNHRQTFRNLISANTRHPQYLELLLFLNANRDNYPSDTRQILTSLKHNYLGTGWKILNTNEISQTANAATVTIERIFNFQAMNITTIATIPGKAPTVSATERNFNECQSDAAIVEAHEKLTLFEKNAPAYRGKNAQTQRRVGKRNRTSANV